MDWHKKFIKVAALIDEIDEKRGRPITREYLVDLYNNRPEEYKQFIQYVKSLVMKRISNGDETIDKDILAKMVKEVMSTFINRSDRDVAEQEAERQRRAQEGVKKVPDRPVIDPAAHVGDISDYVQYPASYFEELRKKHNLDPNLPVARPLVKKPSPQKPSPVKTEPRKKPGPAKNDSEKTKVMDEYINKEGNRRFKFSGVVNDHPAMGKLCECGGRIARVQYCMRDGRGAECALVRYDDGESDMVFLDWTE